MHFWSSFPSWRACRLFPKLVRLPLSVAAFLFDYCREFIRIEIHLVRKASNVIFFIDLLTNAVSRAKWLDFSLQFLFRIVLSWLWQTKKKNRIDRDSVIIDYSGRWSSSSIIGNILCSPYAFSPSSSSVFFSFRKLYSIEDGPPLRCGGDSRFFFCCWRADRWPNTRALPSLLLSFMYAPKEGGGLAGVWSETYIKIYIYIYTV